MAETSIGDPDTSGFTFLFFFNAKTLILSEILADYEITRPRGTWRGPDPPTRDAGYTGLLLYGLFVLRAALFVPFFVLLQIIFQIFFRRLHPQCIFLNKKRKGSS